MQKLDNHFKLARELVKAYPVGSVCSQGELRNSSLQLPRDVNDLRYKYPWNLEPFKGAEYNLISSPCIHKGTKQATDYSLSEQGYRQLKDYYKLTHAGESQPEPLKTWEPQEELVSYKKGEYIYWDTPENVARIRQEGLGI